MALLDLTSVSYAVEDNKNLIYALELFLNSLPNIKVIVQSVQVDVLLEITMANQIVVKCINDQKSQVGVLLCDEFEKTTRPVFSFFLELLFNAS